MVSGVTSCGRAKPPLVVLSTPTRAARASAATSWEVDTCARPGAREQNRAPCLLVLVERASNPKWSALYNRPRVCVWPKGVRCEAGAEVIAKGVCRRGEIQVERNNSGGPTHHRIESRPPVGLLVDSELARV